MTYRELLDHIKSLTVRDLDTEVCVFDNVRQRIYPAKDLVVEDIDPNFAPLIYLTLYEDKLVPVDEVTNG